MKPLFVIEPNCAHIVDWFHSICMEWVGWEWGLGWGVCFYMLGFDIGVCCVWFVALFCVLIV